MVRYSRTTTLDYPSQPSTLIKSETLSRTALWKSVFFSMDTTKIRYTYKQCRFTLKHVPDMIRTHSHWQYSESKNDWKRTNFNVVLDSEICYQVSNIKNDNKNYWKM